MTDRSERSSSEPTRWSDGAMESNGAERAVGALLGRVRQATEPSPTAVPWSSLRQARGAPWWTKVSKHRPAWRLAIVVLVLLATGGAVGAALKSWAHLDVVGMLGLRRPPPPDVAAINDRSTDRRRHAERVARAVAGPSSPPPREAAEQLTPLSPPLPAGGARSNSPLPARSPPAERPRPSVDRYPPRPEMPAAGEATSAAGAGVGAGAGSEAEPLVAAFRELRSEGDPAAALRMLDEYDHRYPRGALRGEARVARAEALLALGRRGEALGVLEEVENSGGTLTRELRITRGELLASNGDCEKAGRDFEAVLGASRVDAVTARALFARASCHLRRGEVVRARGDLERYLVIQPEGPSAADARRALQSLP